ncbi:hypothetical protein AVEN_197450-1 [Araneus ventricosus]|uniref:Uncharacterized protein n=1 Tax=Araneus ventricosus TaxID=182803 RepID=A0A4Y2IBL7_ARAVE|nr:hypothetical protein AVEN_197450-1 [Araneus ventricosus]
MKFSTSIFCETTMPERQTPQQPNEGRNDEIDPAGPSLGPSGVGKILKPHRAVPWLLSSLYSQYRIGAPPCPVCPELRMTSCETFFSLAVFICCTKKFQEHYTNHKGSGIPYYEGVSF